MAGQTAGVNLDIPESIGLPAASPFQPSRLIDIDNSSGRRRGKRRS